MNTMQGAFFFACSNMSRTRDAPTPTNISTKSEPEMVKKGTFASPAIPRASSALPVPGGADADDHLEKSRAGNGEEGLVRLAADRARQQRLAGVGRADQQRPLRD